MNNNIKLWKYKHYKWNEYLVLGIWKHSENLQEFVIYKSASDNNNEDWIIWIRPLDMFFEEVIINWIRMARFEFIS